MDVGVLDLVQHGWQQYSAVVSRLMYDFFDRCGFEELSRREISPITKDLPLIQNPAAIVTCILGYLLIVGLGLLRWKISPKKVQATEPTWLRLLVQVHNVILILLSAYMSTSACYHAWRLKYKFWGEPYDPTEYGMGYTIYIFYVSKLYEFMDTFIMLLKGKVQQVSFLHVYHHGTVSIIWWAIAYTAPGGDAWYSCFLNSFVHVLMYTYYFVAALLGKDDKKKKKYLWWGKYLTQFQMFQFVTMMAQAGYCYLFSPYPKFICKLLFFYMISLLLLFFNFYVSKHSKSKKSKSS